MTRLLSDLLHEHADSASAPGVDVVAIIGAGDRRVRRNRLAVGLSAAAVTAMAVGGAAVLPGVLNRAERIPAVDAPGRFAEPTLTYALGDRLVWGEETFPAEDRVVSYVVTDDALVYTTDDKTVWSFDGADSQRIGHSENGELKADDTGSLVAWVDMPMPGSPEYVVHDTHDDTEVRVGADAERASVHQIDGPDAAFVYAVDDGSVYWRTPPGITRYDVATGTTELLSTVRDGGQDQVAHPDGIDDVADGLVAYPVGSDIDGNRVMIGTSIGDAATKLADGFLADLSPDASYAAVFISDQMHLYRVGGDELRVGLSEASYYSQVAWVDDDTLMAFEVPWDDGKQLQPRLLECNVVAKSCRALPDAPLPGRDVESLVAPTGEPVTQPGDF